MARSTRQKEALRAEDIFAGFDVRPAVRRRATAALIRLVEEVVAQGRPSPYPAANLGGGVERATREGTQLKRAILARSEMLRPEAAAARAGITRQALDLRRNAGQALALSHVKRGFRYPAWQFDDDVAPALAQVLPALSWLEPWDRYFFLTEPEPLLEGRSPLEALREGASDAVLTTIGKLRAAEDT
jgi:hypothetical protein